jgi:peptide deformylase
MAVKKILRIGHPLLLQVAEPVTEFNTPELNSLVQDMFDTMDANDGAGLAAPQIGISRRVVIFELENNPRYPDKAPVPRTVLINPVIRQLSNLEDEDWEGCLSVPGMRGLVPRHTHILYTGYDQFGNKIEREVRDFHARVVQHECDHLDGILYPQRMTNMRAFGFEQDLFPEKTRDYTK